MIWCTRMSGQARGVEVQIRRQVSPPGVVSVDIVDVLV